MDRDPGGHFNAGPFLKHCFFDSLTSVNCSANHPFFQSEEWKEGKELSPLMKVTGANIQEP